MEGGPEEVEYGAPGEVGEADSGAVEEVVEVGGSASFEPYVVQAEVLEGVSEDVKEAGEAWCGDDDAVELETAERRYIASGGELEYGVVTKPADGGEAELL